jgi:hypothetical protein
VILLNRVNQRCIDVRERELGDPLACLFHLALGTDEKPRASGVQTGDCRAIDGRFGGVAECQVPELGIDPRHIAHGPFAACEQSHEPGTLLDPEPRAGVVRRGTVCDGHSARTLSGVRPSL